MGWSSPTGWNGDGWSRAAVVGGAPTSWDNSNKFQITLTNGFLTATNSVGAGQFGTVRSLASHATGKFHCEWHIDATDSSQIGIGVCNASQTFAGGQFMGSGANNVGFHSTDGDIMANSVTLGNIGAAVLNDVVVMEIDIGAGLGWWARNAGNWNGSALANPATGVGGFTLGVTGALFIFADVESSGTIGTLNAGGSAYARTPSAGPFGNW